MSGVHRFLSRREKKPATPHTHHAHVHLPHTHHHDAHNDHKDHHQPDTAVSTPDHFGGLFTLDDADRKRPDKEEEKKIKAILARLHSYGIEHFVESNVEYALRSDSSKGDPEAAFKLLMLLQDTYEGIVRPFNPDAKLLGAVNRKNVTCYLDALLFAMFARLDSFEAMLYENFADIPRRKLAGYLRLWVNLLRSGKLIPTDITSHLQEALAECGWEDAAKLRQQDPSEAFGFITGKLELPLLTLKMDLYHTGKADQDDHKFVNERLLEVAIADEPSEGNSVLTLEDCLEHYFNNRIEVKRHLEAQRRNTLPTNARVEELKGSETDEKATSGMHVEVAEVPDSPTASTPIAEAPNPGKFQADKLRPGTGRKRTDSIFSQRRVDIPGAALEKKDSHDSKELQDSKGRKLSTKTEVLMPAWQFFKLLPWYTDHMPTSDAQVAAHFSRKRPVLGICLKRYSYTSKGEATRLNTYVDIPLEIAVPNFVSDDNMQDDGPLMGNFRLLLQSVVCHRGVSVHSGHYVCLARGQASNADRQASANSHSSGSEIDVEEPQDPWMRFDDLARDRISYVDIHKALREETPYLLFYQVQPIGDDGHSIHDLPSYAEATSRSESDAMPLEKVGEISDSDIVLTETISESANHVPQTNSSTTDFGKPVSTRVSLDIPDSNHPRKRSSASLNRREQSITFDEGSFAGSVSGGSVRTDAATNSVPVTPVEEKGSAFLAVAKSIGSRRASRVSNRLPATRSRPSSTGPAEKEASRFSLNMSKLTARMSRIDMRDSSNSNGNSNIDIPAIQPSDAVAAELAGEKDAPVTSTVVPTPNNDDPSPDYVAKTPPQPHQATASTESIGTTKPLREPEHAPPPVPEAQGTPRKRKDKDKFGKDNKRRLSMHHNHKGEGQEERDCVVM